MTQEECLKIGGHCFKMSNEVLASNPPQYIRYCKHCGLKQYGTEQPNIDWH